jgi:hypothetical protein
MLRRFPLFVICAAVASSLPRDADAQIIQNGGFEEATLAPWVSSGDANVTTASANAQEGGKYAVLAFKDAFFTASSMSFSQEITLASAGPVILEFFAQRFDPVSGTDHSVTFEARVDATVLTNTLPPFSGSAVQANGWARFRFATPTSLPAGTHTVTFAFTRADSLFGRAPQLAIDAVSATQVSSTLIYEGFDITPGATVAGSSGATSTGWEGAWSKPNFVEGGVVRAESLVRPPGTESFFPEPVGGSAFCTGLQGNFRLSPGNLVATPSLWGSFLAQPTVRRGAGFNIGFKLDVPCCGGGSFVSFGNAQNGTDWQISSGFVAFDTGIAFTGAPHAVVFQLEFNVSGTKDRLRVWFDSNPISQPPSFTVDSEFGEFAPRFSASFGSSNNFDGSDLAVDEIRVGAFQDVVKAPAQLLNISTRLRVLPNDQALIGGLIVTGTEAKKVMLRAIGPSLAAGGVTDALANPTLELFGDDGSLGSNDNWKVVDATSPAQSQEAEISATGIQPSDDAEAALVRTLVPGSYTVVVRGAGNASGVGLVEAYDLALGTNSKLANISTRGFVDTGDNVMIGGFIVGSGAGNTRIVVRALGPSLGSAGVPNPLQDPNLELVNSSGVVTAANDNWREHEADVTATGIPPGNDAESALVVNLAPGPYTAIVRGKDGGKGVGLVEAYNIP